ncbi:3-deoxy-7-phosphoheptulonate synthase [Lachnospiraceae bacterium ZAX-1]
MGFSFIKELPSPAEIQRQYPMSKKAIQIKQERDILVRDIILGNSDKFLVIIGPCSADKEEPVCDYISRLKKVQDKVADRLVIVPRIYTNKPRTTGEGYKGIAHQPNPEGKPDLLAGLIAMRKMHLRAIEESGLTAADEMLYPENWGFVEDLLSYVAIGARSVEDQHHRLTVSGFDVPAGMKNPTSGVFSVMLNSVYAAQHPHHFIYRGYEVRTTGNELTHVVLRGAVTKQGTCSPNYHYEDLIRLIDMYDQMDLKNPAAIIDSNHSNSNKQYEEQVRIVKEVMHNRRLSPAIHKMVKGVMIESYIEPGCQKVNEHVYGKSITDPCLGWEDSEKLLYDIAQML